MTLRDIFKPRMQGRSNLSRDLRPEPTNQEVQALRDDAAKGNTEGVEAFFQKYDPHYAVDGGINGWSPLSFALWNGQTATAAVLAEISNRAKLSPSLQMA